eukprot:COSAG06_NODE_18791_length_868_cov_8.633290_1_plen_121_part_10
MLAADDTSGSTAASQDGAAPTASWCGTHERFAESPVQQQSDIDTSTSTSTDTVEQQTDAASATDTSTDKVELNSRPATCAPTLSGAAAEAAAAVAPLGVAALIDLPADMTTPAKDDAFQHS